MIPRPCDYFALILAASSGSYGIRCAVGSKRKRFELPDSAASSKGILSLGALATGTTVNKPLVQNAKNHHNHEAGQGSLDPEEASQRTLNARGQVNSGKAQPAAMKGRNAYLI